MKTKIKKTLQGRKAIYAIATLLLVNFTVKAQEETPLSPTEILANDVAKLKSSMDAQKKLKISGYVQTQFQIADSSGIKSFAGGDFAPNVDKRFAVRRGRFKIAYDNAVTLYTIQVDITEKGVGIKDAYVKVTEPWLKAFSLTAGVFDRPFGFEISYSSSLRESPERSRLFQTIFPDERDLGAKISFQPPKTSDFNFLKIDGGLFNGTGPKASDFDFQKDFIGHLAVNKTILSEKITCGIGTSYYNGGWRRGTSTVYNIMQENDTTLSFIPNKDTANYGTIARREYKGVDAQITLDFPFGLTTLRGEYITGRQPGTSSSSKSPDAQPASDTYNRDFEGAYFYFLQNIFSTKNQLVVKYDWYDPNIRVSRDEIGKNGSKLNGTDIKYTTLGLGWVYRWDNNVKLTAYYDMVANETSSNQSGYTKDLKDNVLTLRMQYKF